MEKEVKYKNTACSGGCGRGEDRGVLGTVGSVHPPEGAHVGEEKCFIER